jgi:hypothetical protein
MADRRAFRYRACPEVLETRFALSGLTASNVIGTATGVVTRRHEISQTSITVAPRSITPHKHGTILGLFVEPGQAGSLQPRVLAAKGNSGKPLPLKHGRSFRPGVFDQTVAFTKTPSAGQLSTDVAGGHGSTGTYQAQTTLVGDVNGDGVVNFADLQAFAPAYMSRIGDPNYIPAADFNQNGIINLYDAKVLLHNMAPLATKLPLTARLTLAPQDQIHYSGPTISGAATFNQVVTILGRTTPGSLVIEDNHTSRLPGGTQAYKFTGPAHATDANGFFSITARNTEGLNNNDFLILDPFGQQIIMDFPIFWIPFATGKGVPRENVRSS